LSRKLLGGARVAGLRPIGLRRFSVLWRDSVFTTEDGPGEYRDIALSDRYDDIAEPGRDADWRCTVGMGIIERLGGRGGGIERLGVSGREG
jgi:hypothetical protein